METLFEVLDKIPDGWHVCEGASMAPLGYLIIANNVSRFDHNGGRKTALINENLINQYK